MGVISSKLGNLGVVTTSLDEAVGWARTGAMWPVAFGLACGALGRMAAEGAG